MKPSLKKIALEQRSNSMKVVRIIERIELRSESSLVFKIRMASVSSELGSF